MPPRRLRLSPRQSPPGPQGREISWTSMNASEASEDVPNEDFEYLDSDASMADESDHGSEQSTTEAPNFPTISDVHRALHPLQATADRIGKQVELFAESLDRLGKKKQQDKTKHPKDCRHVLSAINAYKTIAGDAVQHLQKLHAPEKQRQLAETRRKRSRKSTVRSRSGSAVPRDSEGQLGMTTVDDLKRWEQEEQTWDVLGLMLQIEYPVPEAERSTMGDESDFVRPSRNSNLHLYSSEKELWDNYLASDDHAWERHTVIEWLKKSADMSGRGIDEVVDELESNADRGRGLAAHSWLYTKEAIKQQKRLRTWPRALEPDNPGLETQHMNSEKTKALITQLDPDAISRQDRSLETQDKSFERAMWLGCWEMVRRGKDWNYVREWCKERLETWRATSMGGDIRIAPLLELPGANWSSRYLWRKTCAVVSKDGGIDEYENAVYGVFGGHLPSVQRASRCWDDHFFAHYNSYLLHSYDKYIKTNFPERIPSALSHHQGSFNFNAHGGQRSQSGNQLVEKLKLFDKTKQEATEPLKMLQSSIIAKRFDDFVFRHGVKLTLAANTQGRSNILVPMNPKLIESTIVAPISTQDHELLRMMAHMIFIYQDLGHDFGEGDHRFAMESIIVAYVDYLSKAGKQQLLPLYASRLSPQRAISCLGRQLPLVQEHGERQTMMRLIEQSGLDVPGVLMRQLQLIIMDTPPQAAVAESCPPLQILEQASKESPLARPVKGGFLGQDIRDEQIDLIHAFEWYLLLEGYWEQTMVVGEIIYKYFLRLNALPAARQMSHMVPFSRISLAKTYAVLGKVLDISKDEDDGDNEGYSGAEPRHVRNHLFQRSSSVDRFKNEREILLKQSSTFRDFTNLFVALDAIEAWRDLAGEVSKYQTQHEFHKEMKKAFQKAHDEVEAAVEPLLHGWLQNPRDEAEAEEFKQFRRACLPEIVLAYNAVLNFSSHYLKRDMLIKSMDLAALIAAEGSDLADCFMEAGRMPELVDTFAVSSKNMIRAEEKGGKSGKSRKAKHGETLDLWTVRAPSV